LFYIWPAKHARIKSIFLSLFIFNGISQGHFLSTDEKVRQREYERRERNAKWIRTVLPFFHDLYLQQKHLALFHLLIELSKLRKHLQLSSPEYLSLQTRNSVQPSQTKQEATTSETVWGRNGQSEICRQVKMDLVPRSSSWELCHLWETFWVSLILSFYIL
jgi:hypothetical protein